VQVCAPVQVVAPPPKACTPVAVTPLPKACEPVNSHLSQTIGHGYYVHVIGARIRTVAYNAKHGSVKTEYTVPQPGASASPAPAPAPAPPKPPTLDKT
jgi:hypothetical protein